MRQVYGAWRRRAAACACAVGTVAIRTCGFPDPDPTGAITIAAMKKPKLKDIAACPCGSGLAYGDCCGRWHAGLATAEHAPTPEALMRSRYSAYVLGLTDYLLATWHPSTSPGELELSPVTWLGLEVRTAQTAGDAGLVEFVARYREQGRGVRLHELSRFVREQGRWRYIDGTEPGPD